MRSATLFILLALTTLAFAAQSERDVFVTQGIVADGDDTGDTIWFELMRVDQRFVLQRSDGFGNADAVLAALKASNGTGRSITVYYYAGSGSFTSQTAKPIFVVAKLVYDGRTIEGNSADAVKRMVDNAKGQPQPVLARAVALYGMGKGREALPSLDEVIAGGRLPANLQALALKTRGGINATDATNEYPPGDARDRLLIAALADFRAWKSAAPDDVEAAFAEGRALLELGAYDEALETFRAALVKWPDEYFWAHIRMGAVYRARGDYAKALEMLDELVAKHGPQDGMAFHYHRGWTLTLLGRNDEAIAEFTAGLRSQPDYYSALLRRACAYGRKGRLREALADQQAAIAEARSSPQELITGVGSVTYLRRMDEIANQLRDAIRRDEHAAVSIACDGYWDFGDDTRSRSALLPPRQVN